MEESRLRGKGLYCCFVDFKKAFDTVPRQHLWRRMEEFEVPSEYMLAISRIYEKVICCVRMRDRLSNFSIALLVLSKAPHSHKHYLVYALMNWKKWLPSL